MDRILLLDHIDPSWCPGRSLFVSRRYLIVVPRPFTAAPRMYVIVVPKPLPAAPLVVRHRFFIVAPRLLPVLPLVVLRR